MTMSRAPRGRRYPSSRATRWPPAGCRSATAASRWTKAPCAPSATRGVWGCCCTRGRSSATARSGWSSSARTRSPTPGLRPRRRGHLREAEGEARGRQARRERQALRGGTEEAEGRLPEGAGPWYAVHRGYEVQICDGGEEYHRTGAVYSLSKAAAPEKKPTEWKAMVTTLKGKLVLVDVDGERVSAFDPEGEGVPKQRQW